MTYFESEDIDMCDMTKRRSKKKRKYCEVDSLKLADQLDSLSLLSITKKYKYSDNKSTSTETSCNTKDLNINLSPMKSEENINKPNKEPLIIDMKKERELVEQYYKKKNAELTKAMFG